MKIKESELRKIIKESIVHVLNERVEIVYDEDEYYEKAKGIKDRLEQPIYIPPANRTSKEAEQKYINWVMAQRYAKKEKAERHKAKDERRKERMYGTPERFIATLTNNPNTREAIWQNGVEWATSKFPGNKEIEAFAQQIYDDFLKKRTTHKYLKNKERGKRLGFWGNNDNNNDNYDDLEWKESDFLGDIGNH